jgi:hypothetical protein
VGDGEVGVVGEKVLGRGGVRVIHGEGF